MFERTCIPRRDLLSKQMSSQYLAELQQEAAAASSSSSSASGKRSLDVKDEPPTKRMAMTVASASGAAPSFAAVPAVEAAVPLPTEGESSLFSDEDAFAEAASSSSSSSSSSDDWAQYVATNDIPFLKRRLTEARVKYSQALRSRARLQAYYDSLEQNPFLLLPFPIGSGRTKRVLSPFERQQTLQSLSRGIQQDIKAADRWLMRISDLEAKLDTLRGGQSMDDDLLTMLRRRPSLCTSHNKAAYRVCKQLGYAKCLEYLDSL